MNEEGNREGKETFGDQKGFGGDRCVDDEETIGDAGKHLRPCEGAMNRVANKVHNQSSTSRRGLDAGNNGTRAK